MTSIQPDPAVSDHFYAFVSDFLEFDRPVPFRYGDHYYEAGLRRADGGTSRGAFGRAVRLIADAEFDLILKTGFETLLAPAPGADLELAGFADEPAIFDRPVVERVISRPFRDAAFSGAVKSAYQNTCAVTGLRILNGGGRSAGCAHPAGSGIRARLRPKRSGSVRHDPLDVRSWAYVP